MFAEFLREPELHQTALKWFLLAQSSDENG